MKIKRAMEFLLQVDALDMVKEKGNKKLEQKEPWMRTESSFSNTCVQVMGNRVEATAHR